jgi:hypothetical protein
VFHFFILYPLPVGARIAVINALTAALAALRALPAVNVGISRAGR